MESPKKRLRFRDLRSKTLAFKKRNAIAFCDLKTSLGARACVQVLCVQKNAAFCVCVLSGPNRAMQPRCAMRFESHTPKSLAMRKSFFR